MAWAIANLCVLPLIFFAAVVFGVIAGANGMNWNQTAQNTAMVIVGLSVLVVYVLANFQTRAALQATPIDLPLGGVMTFLFGPVYFQYLLHDYVLPDAVDVFGPIPTAPAYVPATSPEPPR